MLLILFLLILKTHFYHTPKLYHPQPLANKELYQIILQLIQLTSKHLVFRHTTSLSCFSAGYVDYAKKMIFQV